MSEKFLYENNFNTVLILCQILVFNYKLLYNYNSEILKQFE